MPKARPRRSSKLDRYRSKKLDRDRSKKLDRDRSKKLDRDRYRRSGWTGEVRAGKYTLRVAWTHAGIAFVDDAGVDVSDVERRLKMHLVDKTVPALIRSSVLAAARGAREIEAPIDVSWASEYVQEVLAAAMRIPWGQTRPYSWLAREARRPLAVRAAASAIANNPLWLLVPCHRVIAADGTIGSYGPSGNERKRELLAREGVVLPARPRRHSRPAERRPR